MIIQVQFSQPGGNDQFLAPTGAQERPNFAFAL